MKRAKLLSIICILVILISLTACVAENEPQDNDALLGTITEISKYGNVKISTTKAEMAEKGMEFGDVVTVSFADESIDVPYCETYSDVDAGAAGVFGRPDDDVVTIAVNVGDFATNYGIATKTNHADQSYEWVYCEGVDATVTFAISLKQKRGYYDEYVLHKLSYTDLRADYPALSDEEFGNFRVVATTGMGEGVLYRSATPVDPQKNRNVYVDAAARAHGITVIINLNDSEDTLSAFDGFETSYFATTDYVALNMGLDFTQDDFKQKLAEGLRYMGNHDGIYLVHCLEGKDRTGFVIALLEFLMGASYQEAEDDYMVTYHNYYGVDKGDPRYEVIATSNFEKNLLRSFGIQSVKDRDLVAVATEYMLSIGLSQEEITRLQTVLSK